jgi:microcystin-dependent protein
LINISGDGPSGSQPFLGQVTFFAGDFAPGGAAEASGQFLATNLYPALYSLLGTNYGGNGSNAFALPDLRGRVPMGIGQGTGLSARSLAQKVGVESVPMVPSQLPVHQHAMPGVPPLAPLTGFTGSNQPLSLVQPSLALRFLIATNGEVPSPTAEATNTMLGEIQLFAGTTVPSGWAPCDGQVLNIAAHPALYGVISNFYGGDGVTTFALPDLRGRIPVGSPTGQPGAAYGIEEFVLTEGQMPPHNHSVPALEFFGWGGYFGLSGADAGFESDPDSDGLKNGYEWATGTDPVNATSFAPLTIRASAGQARVGFTRNTNATDVTIHLQRTIALGNSNAWSGLITNALGVWSAPSIVTESGTNSVKSVEVSDALTNNPAAHYRLKVTRP